MNYSIEVKNITKKLGDNIIIDDASFKLEKGKIYGLVGANGSGKSTLLKVILGLYNSKGKVFINGMNIREEYRSCLSKIGGIVDYVSLYEYLTAYENLRYFCFLYDAPLSRISEVLKITKLSKDHKTVNKYSLGMKQRLGIAISLLKDPEILILDEPTNGLDPKGIVELRELLKSFKDKTIIISSHIISEIEKLSDEVLFIHNNKVYQKKVDEFNRYKIKFKLGKDYKPDKSTFKLNEKGEGYLTEREISEMVKTLVKKDIPVYGIEKENSLESELISLIEGDNND